MVLFLWRVWWGSFLKDNWGRNWTFLWSNFRLPKARDSIIVWDLSENLLLIRLYDCSFSYNFAILVKLISLAIFGCKILWAIFLFSFSISTCLKVLLLKFEAQDFSLDTLLKLLFDDACSSVLSYFCLLEEGLSYFFKGLPVFKILLIIPSFYFFNSLIFKFLTLFQYLSFSMDNLAILFMCLTSANYTTGFILVIISRCFL